MLTGGPAAVPFGTAELARLVERVASMPTAVDDADRIERVRHFEALKAAVAAAQMAETAAFAASQRAQAASAGVPAARRDRGIASQIGLARQTSLNAAQRFVGASIVISRELPETFAALRVGDTSEWRAMLVARETACLSLEHRARVDRELGPRLERLGDRQVEMQAKQAAYRLDPAAVLARSRRAVGDRRVTVRPAPDTMARLTILAPVAQAVAGYAALTRAADSMIGTGENIGPDGAPRSRSQVMADLAIERLTGQSAADEVAVEVEVVISADTLLETDTVSAGEPALITAPGQVPVPVPADYARDLVARAPKALLRRLFAAPASGSLVAMETQGRLFTASQRAFLRHRDGVCATPWCNAPVRHADHVTPHHTSGHTRLDDARGLCEACNYAAQAPDWQFFAHPDGTIDTVTPTGHHYRRPPPDPLPGADPDAVDEWQLSLDQRDEPPEDYIDCLVEDTDYRGRFAASFAAA